MKKYYLLTCFIISVIFCKAQSTSCNVSTYTPNAIFYAGPATTFSATVYPIRNYLCPNAIVYDTLGDIFDRNIVMIESGANYIWNMCGPAQSHIYVKAGGTITFNKIICPTSNQVYLEPGSIVVDPYGAMGAVITCPTLTFPVVNCLASVHELEKNNFNFSVYPNPVSNSVFLNLQSDISEIVNIKFSNHLGETVLNYPAWNSSKKEIPITNLSNGIYFISIESKGVSRSKKIVVLK